MTTHNAEAAAWFSIKQTRRFAVLSRECWQRLDGGGEWVSVSLLKQPVSVHSECKTLHGNQKTKKQKTIPSLHRSFTFCRALHLTPLEAADEELRAASIKERVTLRNDGHAAQKYTQR